MVAVSHSVRKSLDDPRRQSPGTLAASCRAFDSGDLELARLRVTVRPLHANDVAGYREFVARINRRDLRLRFGDGVDALAYAPLARLVEAKDDVTLIATVATEDSGLEIAGDVRARIDPHPYGSSAEFAIVVRSDLQGMGLGRALLEKLIEECRAGRVERLYGLVAPSNSGMLALARGLGFDVEHVPGGTTVVVSLDLQARQSPSVRRSGRLSTQAPREIVRTAKARGR